MGNRRFPGAMATAERYKHAAEAQSGEIREEGRRRMKAAARHFFFCPPVLLSYLQCDSTVLKLCVMSSTHTHAHSAARVLLNPTPSLTVSCLTSA